MFTFGLNSQLINTSDCLSKDWKHVNIFMDLDMYRTYNAVYIRGGPIDFTWTPSAMLLFLYKLYVYRSSYVRFHQLLFSNKCTGLALLWYPFPPTRLPLSVINLRRYDEKTTIFVGGGTRSPPAFQPECPPIFSV